MKRLALAFLFFTVGCGQSLVELPDVRDNTPGAPTLTGILPQRGVTEGGTSVVLTGTNLRGTTEVAFGDTPATFTVNSDTQVTAVSPPGTSSVNVTVVTPSGRSNGLPYAYGDAPLITDITPRFSDIAGGASVVITGSGFTDITRVRFGGTDASSFTVTSATQITAVTPAHVAGVVQVVVTSEIADSNGFDFAYGSAPALTSIAPATGPVTGGTTVTLTGERFTSATQVTFGTEAVTTLTVVSDTQLTVVTPAHAAGAVDVTVTTLFGTSGAVTFTYGPLPALVTASPNQSPVAGGVTVVLTGTGLLDASSVLFGTVAADSFTVDSDTQITTVAPAGTDSVNITVVTPFGTSNGLPFGYGVSPLQSTLAPSLGLIAGGETVTITGERFTGATSVTFDGASAAFTVDSNTQITAIAPAHARGIVDVITTTPFGVSNPLGYAYGAVPAITSLAPALGPIAGGTSVVITGTDFNGATAVSFGGLAASDLTVVNATQISVTTPPHAAGNVDVIVTTPYGTSAAATFTYGAPPAITTLTPDRGAFAGGTSVVIAGTALSNATSVLFGGTPAASFVVNSATQITAVTPAGTDAVNVTVITDFGTSNGLPYAYGDAPAITSLSPSSGLTTGGDIVTITGSGFTPAATVLFGSATVSATVVSSTQITVSAPANAVGPVNVTVTTSFGPSNAAQYTYGAPPTITSLSPTSGPTAGGTSVTISGTNLGSASSVTFGGAAATIDSQSANAITVTTPARPVGSASVVVTTVFGSATTSFDYANPPTLTNVSPTTGSTDGGTSVVLTGTNLADTTAVTFGGDSAANLSVVNANTITVTTPAHAAGAVDVTVTTPSGSTTLTNAFTFEGPPTITGVSPAQGETVGNTTVVIQGSNFASVTSVTFDGVTASVTNNTGNALTVVTPAHAAGAVDIVVTSPTGTATAVGAYTYTSPGTITGTSSGPGAVNGTGLAWLGTSPSSYVVFSCPGNGCTPIPDFTPTGPVSDTSIVTGPSTWSNSTVAICAADVTVYDAARCTNAYFQTPP